MAGQVLREDTREREREKEGSGRATPRGEVVDVEEAKDKRVSELHDTSSSSPSPSSSASSPSLTPAPTPSPALQNIQIIEADPVLDRKSAFVGRACRITDPAQVPLVLAHLMADRHIARAAHPVINAWRCQVGGVLHQGAFILVIERMQRCSLE